MVCSDFLCSQHNKLMRRDENAHPVEAGHEPAAAVPRPARVRWAIAGARLQPTRPGGCGKRLLCFESVLAELPSRAIAVLVIDDLKAFMQPPERRNGTTEVLGRLLDFPASGPVLCHAEVSD